METNKKSEPATDKLWRLEQVRAQMKEFKQWFHPEPDEVAHLLYLAREWARLADLEPSEKDFAGNSQYRRACEDSMFPRLIRFCKDNLDGIARYCENRRSSGKGTLRDGDIQTIKQLCQADDLATVEQLCLYLGDVGIAGMLARIMRTCYRALKNPGTLDDLSISELRGDLLEVVALTYADIITVMREEAERSVNQGLAQVKSSIKSIKAVRKTTDNEEAQMEKMACDLREKHPQWTKTRLAQEINKKFTHLSVSSIRQRSWLKKLTELEA